MQAAGWYVGAQTYRQETIAPADDALASDGVSCLSFEQARSKALDIVAERKVEEIASASGPAPTVRSAIETYINARQARDLQIDSTRKGDARARLTRHVLSTPLADRFLHALTETDLMKWRDSLSDEMAQATVRRLVNDLKAALNATATKKRNVLPAILPGVIKNGLKSSEVISPVARDKQALPDTDVRKIIDAAARIDDQGQWEGDLHRMIVVLAATGARFSQARRLLIGDVQLAQSRIMLPVSHKGRGAKQLSHIGVRVGDDVLALLRPALAGRRASETLLERWRHVQVRVEGSNRPVWKRDRRGAWLYATELTRPWLEILRIAGLPRDVVPYALRHSSIVRQLRMGLPVRLVAALHDTSTKMIEAHYAAAIVDALDDLAAGAVIPLVNQASDENVVRLADRTA